MSSRARLLILISLLLAIFAPTAAEASPKVKVSNVRATEITHESARVTGTVQATRTATVWLEYRAGSGAWLKSGEATVQAGQTVSATAVIPNLPADTPVAAKLVAVADGDRATGAIGFRTLVAPPAEPPVTPTPTPTPTPQPTDPPADPAPSPEPAPGDSTPPAVVPAPVQGASVVAAPASGAIRVRLPGSDQFVALDDASSVPVGSIVDATSGKLALSSAVAGGLQDGLFWGARFKVTQSASGDGRTDLRLRGRGFAGCARPTGLREVSSLTAVTAGNRKRRIRRLWGKDDGGRFRTHGRDSVATVRGTRWVTTDRCDGTVTRVLEGAVDVRDRHTGRVVRVEAGERHLAKHRR